jgi:hypothetical protein
MRQQERCYFLAGTILADSDRTLGGLVALPAGE